MNRKQTVAAILLSAVIMTPTLADDVIAPAPPAQEKASAEPVARKAPKELTQHVTRGLTWLAQQQLPSGAWGQGEESQQMRGSSQSQTFRDTPNVADTCMATMALFRAGSTPKAGEYRSNILRAVDFICTEVEGSDEKSLFITSQRNTRTQGKLGTYIDTFMAAQLLAEIKGLMPDEKQNQRVDAALARVIRKIEINQKENGQWVNQGWAPTLAQAQCAKALNIAAANGVTVSEQVRERAESFARADFAATKAGASAATAAPAEVAVAVSGPVSSTTPGLDLSGGGGAGGAAGSGAVLFRAGSVSSSSGDAGVALYSSGSQIAAMQASAQANGKLRDRYTRVLNAPDSDDKQKNEARDQLKRFDDNERDLAEAQRNFIAKLNDDRFIAGFGSNGGEEFLSYLNIGESLYAKGGEDWEKWDQKISGNLNQVQNGNGSWSGHHCITGRTFCTSAALMVLTIDRAPLHPATNGK